MVGSASSLATRRGCDPSGRYASSELRASSLNLAALCCGLGKRLDQGSQVTRSMWWSSVWSTATIQRCSRRSSCACTMLRRSATATRYTRTEGWRGSKVWERARRASGTQRCSMRVYGLPAARGRIACEASHGHSTRAWRLRCASRSPCGFVHSAVCAVCLQTLRTLAQYKQPRRRACIQSTFAVRFRTCTLQS